jgi:hypothetical protein
MEMNRNGMKYFIMLCPSLSSQYPIYTIPRGCLYMDNSLTSCLGYFIYLSRTVVKRSDSLLLYIHLEELKRFANNLKQIASSCSKSTYILSGYMYEFSTRLNCRLYLLISHVYVVIHFC